VSSENNTPSNAAAEPANLPAPESTATEQKPADKQPADKPKAAKQAAATPARRGGWWWLLLVLILLGVLAAAGWFAQRLHQQMLTDMAVLRDRIASTQDQERRQQQDIAQLQQQLQTQQQSYQQLQQQLQHNSDRLAQLPGAERQDWLLAEAEYLLRLANQRLQLERDWNGALSLLQAADAVLVETRNPGLTRIRETLAQDMLALRQAPALDATGAVLRLQALQQQLPQLPWLPDRLLPDSGADLLAGEAQQPLPDSWYGQLWHKISTALTGLVRIRERADAVATPLTPDQQYYLQQNMNLMLEQAQAALLREQADLYGHSLQRVQNWLQQYLLIEDDRTRAVQQSLQELQAWPVAPERPDISRSLLQLQQWVEQQRRGMAPVEESA